MAPYQFRPRLRRNFSLIAFYVVTNRKHFAELKNCFNNAIINVIRYPNSQIDFQLIMNAENKLYLL